MTKTVTEIAYKAFKLSVELLKEENIPAQKLVEEIVAIYGVGAL